MMSQEGDPTAAEKIGRRPSRQALRLAALLDRRVGERPYVPVRRAFVENLLTVRTGKPIPPLAELVRGGRGGSVRLRLLLSMLWLASAPPHDITLPSRAWAVLLDLEDPEKSGTRRVSDAMRWLQKRRYIDVIANSGQPNTLRLRSEAGTGEPYELPGAAYNRLRDADDGSLEEHLYIRLPSALWTSGWMAVLSPAAIAMLLILFVQVGRAAGSRANPATTPVWISPSYAKDKFALSEDTRSRGLQELERAGLVTVQRRELDDLDFFAVRKYRNVYQMVTGKFDSSAFVPPERPSARVEAHNEATTAESAPQAISWESALQGVDVQRGFEPDNDSAF